MKNLISIILFIAFSCFWGCSDKRANQDIERGRAELQRLREKSKKHISLADETGIDSLVHFFEGEGTKEDLFVATFYRSWFLYDNNDLPRAYESFRHTYDLRQSAEQSATTDDIMRSVYTMLMLISEKEGFEEQAVEWCTDAEGSGVFADSTLYILLHAKAMLKTTLHEEDSCLIYMNRSLEEMLKNSCWDENMSWCLNEQTAYCAMQGNMEEFTKRRQLLRAHPYHGVNRSTDLCTGLMYMKQGVRDSALYYFQAATNSTDEVALAAYAQLGMDAKRHGNIDSVFICYQKSMECWNSLTQEKAESYTRRLEMLYHTNELKSQVAEQKTHILVLLLGIAVALILSMIGFGLVLLVQKQKKKVLEDNELLCKEQAELESRLADSLRQIEIIRKEKETLQETTSTKALTLVTLNLKQYAAQKSSAPHQLCDEFLRLFAEQHYDAIRAWRQAYADIKPTDILICALVYCDFGLTEVASIINHDWQEVRQFMMRISRGISGSTVSRIADFKALISQ